MDKIDELVTWIQSIEITQILDIIIAIVVAIFSVIISPLLSLLIAKIFNWKKKKVELKDSVIYTTFKSFFYASGIYLATQILNFNTEIQDFIDKVYRVIILWIIAKAIVDLFSKGKIFKSKLKDKANDPVVNIVNKIIKIIIYIFAGYLSLKEFGYDLGVVLTGLGLSTAIIALAAQDAVRDLFSGLAIFWDKPFAIGDWVEIGTGTTTISGSVQEISFRSTKIKAVDDTIITIQNSSISTQNIINWSVIQKRIYKTNLKLPLETEEITVEKVMNRIKFILRYNKDVINESVSVYFNTIQTDGININIYLETHIVDYAEYQKFCNKLNLTILNILETQGVKLAYPGQNVYIKGIEETPERKEKIREISAKKHSKVTKANK